MSEESDLQSIKDFINAFTNETQASIIHLLKIYGKLSTKQLQEKLNIAKTTVLRNLEILVDAGLAEVDEVHEGRGRFPTKFFSLIPTKFLAQGQKLRNVPDFNPSSEMVEQFLRSLQSQYILSREILDQSVKYIDRMIEEVCNDDYSWDRTQELLRDNLGSISLQYMTKSKVWQDIFSKQPKTKTDQHEFLHMKLLLPIRRLVEQMARDHWEVEGDLWYYEDNE